MFGQRRTALHTPHPIHRASFEIHHRKHSNTSWSDGVQDGVWETPSEPPAHGTQKCSPRFRMIEDGLDATLYFDEECRSEPRTCRLVVPCRLIHLSLGEPMKADSSAHLIRALASRNTSSAWRAESGSTSIWASLRRASSAHNCAFSSSASSSRLPRSLSASLARNFGSSFRTSASSSSMLTFPMLPPVPQRTGLDQLAGKILVSHLLGQFRSTPESGSGPARPSSFRAERLRRPRQPGSSLDLPTP